MSCFQWQFNNILVDVADGRLVAGAVEWLFGEILLDVRMKPADKI